MRAEWWGGTSRAAAGLIAATALSFLATLLAARSLGPTGWGSVVLAVSVVGSIAAFLDFSVGEAVVHFGARAEHDADTEGLWGLIRVSLIVDAVVGLVVFAALFFSADFVARAVSRGTLEPVLLRLAAVETLVVTVNGTSNAGLLLAGRAALTTWAQAWAGLCKLAAVVIALALFGTEESVLWAYVIASTIGAAALMAIAVRALIRRFGPPVPRARTPVSPRRIANFGFQTSLTTAVVAIRTGLIAALLGRFAGANEVGVFDVALIPLTIVGLITAPFRITSFPEQAKLAAQGRGDVLWEGIRIYVIFMLAAGGVGVILGYFLLDPLLNLLYGPTFTPAVEPARILLIGALATLLTVWAKSLFPAIGRPQMRTLISLVELTVTGGLLVLLVGRGATGAAVAVSISSVVAAVLWLVVSRRMVASLMPRTGG